MRAFTTATTLFNKQVTPAQHDTTATADKSTTIQQGSVPKQGKDGAETVSSNILSLVDQISKLNLLETSILIKQLKSKLNISDNYMMVGGVPPGTTGSISNGKTEQDGKSKEDENENDGEDDSAKTSAPKTQNVILESFDTKSKAKLIKEMKQLLQLSLVDAKKFVEGAPKVVKENLSMDEATELKLKLEKIGGKIKLE